MHVSITWLFDEHFCDFICTAACGPCCKLPILIAVTIAWACTYTVHFILLVYTFDIFVYVVVFFVFSEKESTLNSRTGE